MDPTDTIASRRHPSDASLLVAGAAVLMLCVLVVDPVTLSRAEVSVLRAVNNVPDLPFAMAWVPMQLGSLAAVPVVAGAALAARRWRLGAALASAGVAAWLAARVVQRFVERGRPGALVDGVVLRDAPAGGLGFVSGHATVAAAMAAVAWPYLGPRARLAVAGAAATVGVLRMYVGAHLPLDIVGGAALGLAAGAAAHLVFGRPALSPAAVAPGPGAPT